MLAAAEGAEADLADARGQDQSSDAGAVEAALSQRLQSVVELRCFQTLALCERPLTDCSE